MSTPIGKYRARAACRAGGLFRRAGDEFEMPKLESVPAHLEEIGASGSDKEDIGAGAASAKASSAPATAQKTVVKGGKPASVAKEVQVGKEDIGAGVPTPVQNVTSADMVTK